MKFNRLIRQTPENFPIGVMHYRQPLKPGQQWRPEALRK
jgi:hypothetical protein